MSKTYRAVVLGDTQRGAFGHWLDLAFARVPEVKLAAIADPDSEGLKEAVTRTGAERGYTDYRQMLKKERPEIAVVSPRWCDRRNTMIQACADAGVAGIYLEKPTAQTLADADEYLDACDRKNIKIAVDHWRAGGEVRLAREMIERGDIGQVQIIRGHGKADQRAGGVDLMLLGTHVLDAMRYLAGTDVAWVHGHVTKDGRDVTCADAFDGPEGMPRVAGNGVTGEFAFTNGVRGSYESLFLEQNLPKGANYLGCEIIGTKGILSLRYRSLRRYARGLWMAGEEFGSWENVPVPPWDSLDSESYYLHCHEFAIRELIQAIEQDRPVRACSSGHDGRAALEIIMAIHESHLSGRRIALPMRNRQNPYDS